MRAELFVVQDGDWEGVDRGVLLRFHELDLGGFKQPRCSAGTILIPSLISKKDGCLQAFGGVGQKRYKAVSNGAALSSLTCLTWSG